jgi:predicted transcriptional regulator
MPKPKGEHHPLAKLTDAAVREIREAYAPGRVSQKELAKEHGVSQQVLSRVLTGLAWAHVE